MNAPLAVVGAKVPRKDAADKVSGLAEYTVDVMLPGMLHAKVLRSPRAHALIRRLDVSKAKTAPGVRASATIGGNLMARRTRYEGAILLAALGARLRFESTSGVRETPVEDNWSAEAGKGALLTTIVIPLRKGLRMDYARDLRPIMTQAVVLEDDAPGRVVTSTEFIVPRIRALKDDTADGALDAADPVTSTTYIAKVSATLLARQLERMGA